MECVEQPQVTNGELLEFDPSTKNLGDETNPNDAMGIDEGLNSAEMIST